MAFGCFIMKDSGPGDNILDTMREISRRYSLDGVGEQVISPPAGLRSRPLFGAFLIRPY